MESVDEWAQNLVAAGIFVKRRFLKAVRQCESAFFVAVAPLTPLLLLYRNPYMPCTVESRRRQKASPRPATLLFQTCAAFSILVRIATPIIGSNARAQSHGALVVGVGELIFIPHGFGHKVLNWAASLGLAVEIDTHAD